jgi:hypothetical protein
MVVSPGVATVDKSKADIQARCTKPGWEDAAATIPSNFEGWTLGNILLGGVIGLGVDAATGAINDYPHTFQIPMTPLYAAVPVAPPIAYAGSSPAAWPPIAATQPVAPVLPQPVAKPAPATFPAVPTPVPTSPQPVAPAAPAPSLLPVAAAPPSISAAPPAAPDIISNPTAVPSSDTYDYEAAKRQYEQAEQLYQSQLRDQAGKR